VSKVLRILVVDDDRMMAKTLVDILRLKGYEAEGVHSGQEALDKAGQVGFDLLVSDIKMPDLNGVELCRQVKQKWPGLPVALMTAYATDRLLQEGVAQGAETVFDKPIAVNDLLAFLAHRAGLPRE
jgi:two-component system response regulator HydG